MEFPTPPKPLTKQRHCSSSSSSSPSSLSSLSLPSSLLSIRSTTIATLFQILSHSRPQYSNHASIIPPNSTADVGQTLANAEHQNDDERTLNESSSAFADGGSSIPASQAQNSCKVSNFPLSSSSSTSSNFTQIEHKNDQLPHNLGDAQNSSFSVENVRVIGESAAEVAKESELKALLVEDSVFDGSSAHSQSGSLLCHMNELENELWQILNPETLHQGFEQPACLPVEKQRPEMVDVEAVVLNINTGESSTSRLSSPQREEKGIAKSLKDKHLSNKNGLVEVCTEDGGEGISIAWGFSMSVRPQESSELVNCGNLEVDGTVAKELGHLKEHLKRSMDFDCGNLGLKKSPLDNGLLSDGSAGVPDLGKKIHQQDSDGFSDHGKTNVRTLPCLGQEMGQDGHESNSANANLPKGRDVGDQADVIGEIRHPTDLVVGQEMEDGEILADSLGPIDRCDPVEERQLKECEINDANATLSSDSWLQIKDVAIDYGNLELKKLFLENVSSSDGSVELVKLGKKIHQQHSDEFHNLSEADARTLPCIRRDLEQEGHGTSDLNANFPAGNLRDRTVVIDDVNHPASSVGRHEMEDGEIPTECLGPTDPSDFIEFRHPKESKIFDGLTERRQDFHSAHTHNDKLGVENKGLVHGLDLGGCFISRENCIRKDFGEKKILKKKQKTKKPSKTNMGKQGISKDSMQIMKVNAKDATGLSNDLVRLQLPGEISEKVKAQHQDLGELSTDVEVRAKKKQGNMTMVIKGKRKLQLSGEISKKIGACDQDQGEASIDVDGRVKKKSGNVTVGRKEKRKDAKKRRRAERNRRLGVKRLKLQPVLKPKVVSDCRFHLLGKCQQGEKCKFSHDAVPATKSQPCCYHAKNSCLKGDDCPYDHELSKYPCLSYRSKGFCNRGDGCLFSHQMENDQGFLGEACDLKSKLLLQSKHSREQPKLVSMNATSHMIDSHKHKETNSSTPMPLQNLLHNHAKKHMAEVRLKLLTQAPKGIRFLSFGESSSVDTDKQQQDYVLSKCNGVETCNQQQQSEAEKFVNMNASSVSLLVSSLGSSQSTNSSTCGSKSDSLPTQKAYSSIPDLVGKYNSDFKTKYSAGALEKVDNSNSFFGSTTKFTSHSQAEKCQSKLIDASKILEEFLFSGMD